MALYKQLNANDQVKVGAGRLYGVLCSSTTTGTLAIYDSADGDTNDPKILNTFTPSAGQTIDFLPGVTFTNGLYIVKANTIEYTVIYE